VLFAVQYPLLRRLLRLLATSKDLKGDVEVVVLRHQLMVLKHVHGDRPASSPSRPVVHAAMSRTRPRTRWSSFVVQPTDAPSL
jgi:hypothetical protein